MTVKEVCEKLDLFTDDERIKYVGALWKLLSQVSREALMEFERNWDGTKGFTEFIKAQAQEIRRCIVLEICQLGQTVRMLEGLPVLMWETEVTES